ncbi:MAG: xanthine dehydrogenase family protein molybdopterin-binding subunit [Janthinobacterium lividum]
MSEIKIESSIGKPRDRADGRLKVTGGAKYTADMPVKGLVYAAIAGSEIAQGRLLGVDTKAAQAVRGVLAVLTVDTMPRLAEAGALLSQSGQGGPPSAAAGQQFLPMQGDVIHYSGQPIALVIAETSETATYAASLVRAQYKSETPDADFESARHRSFKPANGWPDPADSVRGDAGRGLGDAAKQVDEVYHTALQHHVAMEPHATVADWDGDTLTLYEPSTWVQGVSKTVGVWFGMPPEKVHVVQSFVGGSFGSKGPTWPHVALTAAAARHVGRPVKLALTRQQTFWSNGYRPHIRHAVQLGAADDGALTAMRHDVTAHTALFDNRIVAPVTKSSPKLYACPNVETSYRMAHLNLSGPFTMRGPGETPGLFATECAMDEMAYALGMDPIALRVKNYAEIDPENGKPWSSKSLRECYAQGAARFGWDKRSPEPGSMKTAGGKMLGYGIASMIYDAKSAPTSASARMSADGTVVLKSATADPGTGPYTIMPQIAADALGISADLIRLELGDSHLPKAPIAAGSQTSASVGSAVRAASVSLRGKIAALALADPASPLFGLTESQINVNAGRVVSRADFNRGMTYGDILSRHAPGGMEAVEEINPFATSEQFSLYSFGAHFAEVQIDPDLCEVRVTRYVGAFGAGRILNAKTARSQLIGGVVWGLGMALHEETHLDTRLGRIMNPDLAEYHVPVNADIPADMDLFFVDEEDAHVNPLGVKGIGEIGTIGAAAAVANAVYHATGKRIRNLPITPDKLI